MCFDFHNRFFLFIALIKIHTNPVCVSLMSRSAFYDTISKPASKNLSFWMANFFILRTLHFHRFHRSRRIQWKKTKEQKKSTPSDKAIKSNVNSKLKTLFETVVLQSLFVSSPSDCYSSTHDHVEWHFTTETKMDLQCKTKHAHTQSTPSTIKATDKRSSTRKWNIWKQQQQITERLLARATRRPRRSARRMKSISSNGYVQWKILPFISKWRESQFVLFTLQLMSVCVLS